MKQAIFRLGQRTVGAKLTAITLSLVALLFVAAIVLIGHLTSSVLEQHSLAQMQNETNDVVNMIEMFDRSETSQVERFANMLGNEFPDRFSLDHDHSILIGDKTTPVLRNGNTDLNLNFSIPDRIMASTGVAMTIFAKTGDDFVRISTSLKKENGDRAVGTLLDRKHPGYAALLADKPYTGIAKLFGKQYITKYVPLKDAGGQLVGILFVGVDISEDIKSLFAKIKALKVGESGYFSVYNANPGPDFGTLLAGPEDQGKILLERKDTDGKEFIKEMLTQQQGVMR
ncbi:methyl-accepting chemotaxis protein-2 (aspartate sensor receptor) [Herbaspirillum sp. Sphag1AN]|uniref:Cache 3/Cache 2 fusion domain-containing protein n=1 Tax=unclassified Herbaspirillum TaxID=2624150 RepID=UPI0017D537E8|nr:methyl-accepting chemotaxis protein-2 (aspartate sensor receptor) [Herbaspirillum sp. Sphag1AN]MBB3247261.1 methyl-accepting chemotaxis protein-2 (aspartate sensor receptor) [Herbaspirillum sp. Sphag64]